jgi:hypothetical protein
MMNIIDVGPAQRARKKGSGFWGLIDHHPFSYHVLAVEKRGQLRTAASLRPRYNGGIID